VVESVVAWGGGGLGWLNRWWLGVVDSVVAWGG
jgi:hypothetical protein